MGSDPFPLYQENSSLQPRIIEGGPQPVEAEPARENRLTRVLNQVRRDGGIYRLVDRATGGEG